MGSIKNQRHRFPHHPATILWFLVHKSINSRVTKRVSLVSNWFDFLNLKRSPGTVAPNPTFLQCSA